MTSAALAPDDARRGAARIAYALLRIKEPMASPLGAHAPTGHPVLGTDAYAFTPSWRVIPRAEIVSFLVSLPSPALLSPTTTRGMVALTLLHELSGDRRRWGEKTLSNFTTCLDQMSAQLGLTVDSGVLLELDDESDVYPLATVRLWTQQFGVQVGWSLSPIAGNPRAQAQLAVRRSDGRWFRPPQSYRPRHKPGR